MYRVKQLFGGGSLTLRDYDGQLRRLWALVSTEQNDESRYA